jgi:type I restriction enzyme S subunit
MKGRLGWQNLKRDEYTDSGPCLVSSEHFINDRIQWDQVNHVSQERFEMAPEIILKIDDVLFMKDGAAMGKLAYVDSLPCEACLNSHLLVLRPDRNQVLPQFLYYALKSLAFVAYMIQERVGTTFFGFSEESMGNYPLSFPSVEEQRDILNYLNSETSRIDLMINKIMTAIDRLTEYRTALITAATTGKIDVRGVKLVGAK